jgi:ABC-type phosphate transport system substrate-binding protein
MARAVFFIAAFVLVAFNAASALAETVAVIVNSSNQQRSLSVEEIRKFYTNSVLEWPDGTPVTLYDLDMRDPVRSVFSEAVLKKTPVSVAEEWAHLKITNQAKNPPIAIKSEALIVRRVSREKGAIGYVTLEAARLKEGVRIVNIFQN